MDRPWPRIIALWLLGVLAAAQLAKFSTIAPLLRAAFDLDLPRVGLLISLLEVGGALFGFVAGLALGRIGCRRFLLAGLVTLMGTSAVEAIAPTPAILFAARATEGIGYLLVVIAAPTAIAAIADARSRGRALALWSSFVPVGLALGGAITSLAVGVLGARGVMLLWSGLIAGGMAIALRLPITGAATRRIELPALGAWVSTFGFGLYTLLMCAVTMLLPTFLIEQHRATIGSAGLIAALAALSALPGSALAIRAMHDGAPDPRRLLLLATPALIATALLVPLLFSAAIPAGSGLLATGTIAVLAVMISGLVPPMLFARLPILAGAYRPDDPRIATANGLITQFGAAGALLGPPAGALIVGHSGWPGLGIAISMLALAMLATIALAEAAGRQPRSTNA